jgi:hypothetical protein
MLGGDNLLQSAAKVDSGGSPTFLCCPWNRGAESIVDLEGSRAITKTLELMTIS